MNIDVHNARQLCKNKNLPQNFVVMYDDGVACPTTRNRFILTDLLLNMIDHFPGMKIRHTYRIEHFLKDKLLNRSTINAALSHMMADCWYLNGLTDRKYMDVLVKLATDISHHIANVMYVLTEEYVMSVDILDFLELVHHPKLKSIFDNVKGDDQSIKKAYKETLEFLMNEKDISDNAVAVAVRCKMVNSSQITQCLMVRGKVTEVDGHIMSSPVMSNFTKGLRKLADLGIESRSAAKNAFFSETPLEDSEYFARRLQEICMVVERIAPGDCGSTNYENWLVEGPKYDDLGNKVRDSDLHYMQGKWYVDEQTNSLKTIKGDETYLYGKLIKMRSGIKCMHPDKHAICEVCFGELSKNVPMHANLGHLCSATMTRQSTQSTLSVKHLDASAIAASIMLLEIASAYLTVPKGSQDIYIKPQYVKPKTYIVIDKSEVRPAITQRHLINIKDIVPSKLSMLSVVEIIYFNKGVQSIVPLDIRKASLKPHMSKSLISYICDKGYTLDSKGNFVIDLEFWDVRNPLFSFSAKEENASEHAMQISKIIESKMEEMTDRSDPDSPSQTLQALFNLVNERLNVHISCLETILYACMIPEPGNYAMARGAPNPVLGIGRLLISNRDLGALKEFQDHSEVWFNPKSYDERLHRAEHPMAVFLTPHEVIKSRYPEYHPE